MGKARMVLHNTRTPVYVQDSWWIVCLKKFLSQKFQLEATYQLTDLIDSLFILGSFS